MLVAKDFTFCAAHHLPNHDGKCANEHGHNYKVRLVFAGPIELETPLPDKGMVVDFYHIKRLWESVLEPFLDHQDLNLSTPVYPTAEVLAAWIASVILQTVLGPKLFTVVVWETDDCFAAWNVNEEDDRLLAIRLQKLGVM